VEIEENKASEKDNEKIEKAIEYVVNALKKSDDVWLCWTEFPFWIAKEVANRFLKKGYHAKTCQHMKGDGPSWFWYGICIGKHPFEVKNLNKSVSEILG